MSDASQTPDRDASVDRSDDIYPITIYMEGGRKAVVTETDTVVTGPTPPTVTVRIDNEYTDGHKSTHEAEVPAPEDASDLDDWWEDEVFDHTGDGHGIGKKLGSCYTATIIRADEASLVGRSTEWID